ncbi:MAG: 5,6-dimethylbenzimidazole synthase [Acidimicrobiales bacterium]|nr:5,6-dimethylbenzimidazole synthase [Acidimicrobiales bacterium]
MSEEIGLLEGIATTRAVRRYRADPIPEEDLNEILFAASRAPSGSNRQGFRFLVLRDGSGARQARELLGDAGRRFWAAKRDADGYDEGSGRRPDSPKARMARTMQAYVDGYEEIPIVILTCLQRHRSGNDPADGASVYPAVQNLLLAARALGYGGVMTTWHRFVEGDLRHVLDIPDEVFIAATVTLGVPAGRHGPVRRRPLRELVFEDRWGATPSWIHDPRGSRHTAAGPPAQR